MPKVSCLFMQLLQLTHVSVIMTTDRAFEEMIYIRGIHHRLGVTQKLVSVYRQHLKNDRFITLDQKFDLLRRAGYKLIEEPKWTRS